MSASKRAKELGLTISLSKAMEMDSMPSTTLYDWFHNYPERFDVHVMGYVAKLKQVEKDEDKTIVFCPSCNQESFDVNITNSGRSSNMEYSFIWYRGEGSCSNCHYIGEWEDTSA